MKTIDILRDETHPLNKVMIWHELTIKATLDYMLICLIHEDDKVVEWAEKYLRKYAEMKKGHLEEEYGDVLG